VVLGDFCYFSVEILRISAMASDSQYEFGSYRLDAQSGILFREGERVALSPKVAELLVALVQAEGSVLTREQLLQQVWPDTIIEEGSLSSHISMLRKALRTGPDGHDFIETLPKRGYRFAAPVERTGSEKPSSGAERVMLVVLPFENLTTGERYDYFSDGLTEEMITELARLSPDHLGVIARTSAMQFKSTTKRIRQIGGDLGVSHVLEGSVRRVGERVRITAQLIRVDDESHLGLRVTSKACTMCSRCKRKWLELSRGRSRSN
jgi:DNA-binding winged helix-turn-helix (wHTH) protein